MKSDIVYGRWRAENHCVECNKRLTEHDEMYSDGTCPHCGYTGPSAGTIVDSYTVATRNVYKVTRFMGLFEFKKLIGTEIKN